MDSGYGNFDPSDRKIIPVDAVFNGKRHLEDKKPLKFVIRWNNGNENFGKPVMASEPRSLPGWAFPAWMKTEMNRLSVNMAYQPLPIR